jgi:GNAT superfamily N-acetyltransferase
MKYDFVKDYKDNSILRKSFNELTKKTYGFQFEEWYQNGYWYDTYIPYSIADGEKIVANVSVNIMDFVIDGHRIHFIQLGTVMTDKDYRGQGLSRYLIEKIIAEWADKVDGMYLFANDSVLEFYPKFGFRESKEYQYKYKIGEFENSKKYIKVSMKEEESRNEFIKTTLNNIPNARLAVDNLGLIMFYTTSFMSESVYFLPEVNSYVIADMNEDNIFIHQIISKEKVDIYNIMHSFGSKIKEVVLGFTPLDSDGFVVEERKEEDTTLFILGSFLKRIEKEQLMFPTLSHA